MIDAHRRRELDAIHFFLVNDWNRNYSHQNDMPKYQRLRQYILMNILFQIKITQLITGDNFNWTTFEFTPLWYRVNFYSNVTLQYNVFENILLAYCILYILDKITEIKKNKIIINKFIYKLQSMLWLN